MSENVVVSILVDPQVTGKPLNKRTATDLVKALTTNGGSFDPKMLRAVQMDGRYVLELKVVLMPNVKPDSIRGVQAVDGQRAALKAAIEKT